MSVTQGHFHNNVKRWWKAMGEEQHLGPLWSLMTLCVRKKRNKKRFFFKRWLSLNIFLCVCVWSRKHMNQSSTTICCWKYGLGKTLFSLLSAEKFQLEYSCNSSSSVLSGLHPSKNCCHKALCLNSGCVWKKCLLNKVLLLRVTLITTVTCFPWNIYWNWFSLCRLMKVSGSMQ